MITAVDSNILIDVIGNPNEFTSVCVEALDVALKSGPLIICPIIVSETAAWFESGEQLKSIYARMQIELVPFNWEDLYQAGQTYVRYCKRSRKPRERMLADFLIAAHAFAHSDVLLTRDRGYYRTYFPELKLVTPLGTGCG
jgi:predicted nucleic acid-binding protein